MIELVYISRAKQHFSEDQLVELLKQARMNNEKLGISGLLLYDNKGTFIQALEGDEEQVDGLFNKISGDERHSRINRISRKSIQVRAFSDWKMGFRLIDKGSIQTFPGFSSYMQQQGIKLDSNNDSSFAVELLNYFKLSEHQVEIEE